MSAFKCNEMEKTQALEFPENKWDGWIPSSQCPLIEFNKNKINLKANISWTLDTWFTWEREDALASACEGSVSEETFQNESSQNLRIVTQKKCMFVLISPEDTPLHLALPFFQERSNRSCSRSETPPSCPGAVRPDGNPPTLSEWVAPGAGSRCSSDPPSPHTQTPPSCPEVGRGYGGRWSLWEGAGPGVGSRRSFCYRRILIGLSVPGGCSYCGFGAMHRCKRAQGQQKGHSVSFKWHDENIREYMQSETEMDWFSPRAQGGEIFYRSNVGGGKPALSVGQPFHFS